MDLFILPCVCSNGQHCCDLNIPPYSVLCNHRCLIEPFSLGMFMVAYKRIVRWMNLIKSTDNRFWLHLFIEQHAYQTLNTVHSVHSFVYQTYANFLSFKPSPPVRLSAAELFTIHCVPMVVMEKGRQNNFAKRFIAVVLINFSAWNAAHISH